jgi:aminoglycoside phosphotransferase (APT) family kinase protein
MAEPFDIATLAEIARAHLGGGAPQIAPIRTGKHNSSYWVDTSQGRFVLRLAPPDDAGFLFYERRMMRQEPALHALVRARTSIPVAEVVAHDFSRARIDRDYMLMRALPGVPLSDAPNLTQPMVDRALRQVGQFLRQLHALTTADCLGTDAYGYIGEHRPIEPQPTWFDAFRLMWGKLLDDVVACGAYAPAEAAALRDLLDRHRADFARPVVSRLLHMDIWGQNILVDPRGNVTGLVDFDRALWGDVEIEFAVLDYCGISEPAFWEGYGAAREQSPAAETRRLFYLLYEVQKYMPICVWRRGDMAGAARYRQHSLALAAQLGLA